MKLPEKILYCRKRAGLSQEALAERLGVSRQAVSKWETGEALPETGKLAALAAELGVSVDWLLSEAEPEESQARSGDWTEGLPRTIGSRAAWARSSSRSRCDSGRMYARLSSRSGWATCSTSPVPCITTLRTTRRIYCASSS